MERIIYKLAKLENISYKKYRKLLSKYPKNNEGVFSKSELISKYRELVSAGEIEKNSKIEKFLRKKPTRTISGVTPVTVLTKPYPCPGKCIFCPTRNDQPKSYLSSEPGAMRAKSLKFDPYKQVQTRLQALYNIGHSTSKVELIVLGGTWSFYDKEYQTWFIKECFRALNEFKKDQLTGSRETNRNLEQLKADLVIQQNNNVTSKNRCVGLVIETRPDLINEEEIKWIRFLGTTKVQLGVQTLDPHILKQNLRDHTLGDTVRAMKLLRTAGFKLHIHWMVNLFGSTPKKDFNDFRKLINDKRFKPDELKIYPCLLVTGTPLNNLYKEGEYEPYDFETLLDLTIRMKRIVPSYIRISRLFRDIPSFEITAGVDKTNFRQIVQQKMKQRDLTCNCIRCREVKGEKVNINSLKLETLKYSTNVGTEYFLSYNTQDNKIAGFLRLLIPNTKIRRNHFIKELKNSSIIREIHVYGKSIAVDNNSKKAVQHQGLGKKLIQKAVELSKKQKILNISVISAIGTEKYYRKNGFKKEQLYMHLPLSASAMNLIPRP